MASLLKWPCFGVMEVLRTYALDIQSFAHIREDTCKCIDAYQFVQNPLMNNEVEL